MWYPPTNDVFFVQNAGAKAAGTGLAKSAIVQKISLDQAEKVTHKANASGEVDVITLGEQPQVINPNGGTNWRGQVIFAGEGQGVDVPSALYLMNPVEPYNTTGKLEERTAANTQSSSTTSLDANSTRSTTSPSTQSTSGSISPTSTTEFSRCVCSDKSLAARCARADTQEFRGKNNIRRQVYRFNPDTGVVEAVADQMLRPNGLTFSPDGKWLYVADTGAAHGFEGNDWADPASM